jgi:uncharacterized protein (DUF433 family)
MTIYAFGVILMRRYRLMFERISINANVCHGQACIKGTRIPVYLIVQMLANGDTIEELLEDYPSITKVDILACLAYAGALAEDENIPSDVVIESTK